VPETTFPAFATATLLGEATGTAGLIRAFDRSKTSLDTIAPGQCMSLCVTDTETGGRSP
jgi:hypothetical protein